MASICALQFAGLRTRQSRKSRIGEMRTMQESFLSLKTAMDALRRYIPPAVVVAIVRSNTGRVERFMRTKFLGILFVDLQGFTTLSESVQLATLNHLLNTYFEELGAVIEKNGGTIDKFIGDAILALYGAPDEVENPAQAACQTALDMAGAMQSVNEMAAGLQIAPLRCRVGIHCGPVLVGNLGSPSRINYTVCGNGVNVASRMEQLGKEYGVTPLVSGSVAQRVSGRYVCVLLDIVSLRGKTRLTRVYHLACPAAMAPADVLHVQSVLGDIHEHVQGESADKAVALITDSLQSPLFDAYHKALRVLQRHIESGELSRQSYESTADTSLD
eukprot:m51a1_g5894 putative adenylate cyclase (330) ;mRNA; f:537789-538940